jgi:hypothetical protein
VQAREVTAQSGFYSVDDRRLHFGLGGATSADLEIRWPSGLKQSVAKVAADRVVNIKEAEGIISP